MKPTVAPGPVFLICTERSGSNLIEAVLGAHPDVCMLASVHHGHRLLQYLHYTLPPARESAAWRALVMRAAARHARQRGEAEAQRLLALADSRQTIAAADLARFLYLELAPEAQGRLVFIKEPAPFLQHMLFFLLGTFPTAKFVFQVRDPRDFLLSAQQLRGGWPRNLFGSTRQALASWNQDQRFGLAALGLLGQERVHLQRYEDLVGDPEGTLRTLTEFLAIEWDDGLLAFHKTTIARRRSERNPQTFGNLGKPVLRQNFGKWRQGLSAAAVKVVEAHLGELMDRFGYPREHDVPNARTHLLKALFLAPIEHVANRHIHLHRYKRSLDRDLEGLDRVPLLPPIDYPTAP